MRDEDGGSRLETGREGGGHELMQGAHHKGVGYKGKLPVGLACRDRVYGDTSGAAVFWGDIL